MERGNSGEQPRGPALRWGAHLDGGRRGLPDGHTGRGLVGGSPVPVVPEHGARLCHVAVRTVYPTWEHARKDVARYIEFRYNRKRLHSALGYQTPEEAYNELLEPADRSMKTANQPIRKTRGRPAYPRVSELERRLAQDSSTSSRPPSSDGWSVHQAQAPVRAGQVGGVARIASTNNEAERDARPVKLQQRTSGGCWPPWTGSPTSPSRTRTYPTRPSGAWTSSTCSVNCSPPAPGYHSASHRLNGYDARTDEGAVKLTRAYAGGSLSRLGERGIQALRVAREEGLRALTGRALRRAAFELSPIEANQPLRLADIYTGPLPVVQHDSPRSGSQRPFTINWVTTPPSAGSGGHTTILRIVEELEHLGHTCRLYLYDRYLGSMRSHAAVISANWPDVHAPILDVQSGLAPADAQFATSWQTAHFVARSTAPGARFYLVQDHEPSFYPLGSEHVLAEDTYRYGFQGITAGEWLAEILRERYQMRCDAIGFGCDTNVYQLGNRGPRSGIVFYAKPDTPRRAFTLGILALAGFAARHPEVDIHLFGQKVGRLPFRAIDHGRMTPADLNKLYNYCVAGLSLSLTNVSLIPWELLGSGCIPVVNDASHNRIVLDNPFVRYAPITVQALTQALCDVVENPDQTAMAIGAGASVASTNWEGAGRLVDAVLRRELLGG